jgi:hypothetical protein
MDQRIRAKEDLLKSLRGGAEEDAELLRMVRAGEELALDALEAETFQAGISEYLRLIPVIESQLIRLRSELG